MNKRITAFLLCFIMVFSMLVTAIPAHAAPVESTQITITPDKTTATAGDIITYTIKMGPVSDMGTLQMQLVIPEGLTYVANSGKLADGLKTTLGFDDVAFTEASLVINGVAVFADYESDTDTEIATFQCKVNDGFSGNTSVGLTYLEFYSCQTWTNHTSRFSVVEGQVLVESTADPYTKLGDISAVTATADLTPTLGATTSAVSFTITEPTDAAAKGVIISGTSWYKKDASSIYGWTQCSNGVDTFEEGTYRLSVQLRSKSNDDKEYYAMSGDTTFTVNGVQWNSEEPFRDNYATSGYGYRFFVSPEFTLGGKTLDSIAVTTPPTKTAYREGEDFNPAGMVVTATYTDSSTAPVILYTVTDGTDMAAGKTSVTISYTEGGVTETTTQPITVAKEYTVTVNGGTGNGEYIAGEEVSISAFVSTGMQFKEWQGTDGLTFTSGDKNSQTATFTMPAHDVTVTAVTGPAEYYVSVSGGSGTGMYEAGATVTIVADAPEAGKQFKEWVVGDGKVLRFTESDITSSTAKFFMPGEAVRIYATYEDISHICKNNLTKVEATPAGCTEDGNVEYYKCSCGKYFEDASASVEITDKDSVKIPAGHKYGTLIDEVPAKHTVTELKAGMKAHYFCDECDTYFTEEKVETTKAALEIAAPTHDFATVNGYKEADGHADTCACGAHDTVVDHTPDIPAATETEDQKCSVCEYVIAPKLGHIHKNNLTKVEATPAGCTEDGNVEYYKCSCGKYFEDASATVEITDKESVTIKAGHSYDTAWKSDKDNHWNECACGAKANTAAHKDDNQDGKCDICAYEVGIPVTPDDNTPSENPDTPSENPNNPQTGDNSNVILWISQLMLSACGIVATVLRKKRYSVK